MSKKKIQAKKIEYKFKKVNDYRVIAADGVWGGITPNGMIRINLYAESIETDSETYEVDNDKLGKLLDSKPKQDKDKLVITREIQIGANLTSETAMAISKWLELQCKILESNK